jgi:PLD-like domain
VTTTTSQRRIFKGASTTQSVIRELLTLVFCQELLSPGAKLVIVAPWISDVPIFDNRAGNFSALNPEWGQRDIGVIEVLVHLCRAGTKVDVAVRPDEHNQLFVRKIAEAADEAGVSDSIRVGEIENLHTKGILADSWVILGSMNLTRNGIEINEEYVTYDVGPESVAGARVHFNRLLASLK